MEPLDRRMLLAGAGVLGAAALVRSARSGPLDPLPGPVSSTYKTLDEVEPRVPVQSLPGSQTALHVITEPGSYYLTGNIMGEAGKNGIEVRADDVSIDLAGHALIGIVGGGGSLAAITRGDDPGTGLRVFSGHITDWAQNGVYAAEVRGCVFFNLSLHRIGLGIGGVALRSGVASLVSDCVASDLVPGMLNLGNESLAARCVAKSASYAFFSQASSSFIECTATSCHTGFALEHVCVAQDCRAVNCTFGVNVPSFGSRHVIRGSTFVDCATGVHVEGAASATRVEGCSFQSCQTGVSATGAGALVVKNTFAATGAPLALSPGNAHGPLVNVAGVGDISGIAGADQPWANFVH